MVTLKNNISSSLFSRSFWNNTLAFLSGEFFYRFLSFFSCILIARSLGQEAYGEFSFIFVYLSFFEVFVQFGLNPILTRELSQEKENAPQILGQALLIRTALILFTFPVSVFLIRLLHYPLSIRQGAFLASFQLFLTLRMIYESIFKVNLTMIYPALWNGLRAILSLVLVAVVAFFRPSISLFILIYTATGLVSLLGLAFFSKKFIRPDFTPNAGLMKRLLKESFPMMLSGYLTLIYYRTDVLMLSFLKTFNDIGFYSVATRMTEALTMISSAILVSLFPLLARLYKEDLQKFHELTNSAFRLLCLLGLPIAVGSLFVGQELISFFFGAGYAPSGITLAILCWYTFFCFVGGLLANVLIVTGNQRVDMAVSFLLAFLNIGMNFFLIPHFSYNGAAFATVMTEFFGILIYFGFCMKHRQIRLPFPGKDLAVALQVNFLFFILLFTLKNLSHFPAIPFIFLGIGIYGFLLWVSKPLSWSSLKNVS